MSPRSLLFVPGDRPERFAKAAASGADALILDLEDAVAPAAKPAAREAVAGSFAAAWSGPPRYVRVNPLGTAELARDLAALAGTRPDAIMLPKAEGAPAVRALDGLLTAHGLGGAAILPIATETPVAIFVLASLREVAGRLAGLARGAEDLSTAIGAVTARAADGGYTPPYELARSLALFAAHAAQVPAIDTIFPDFRDMTALAGYAGRAARDGFTGMLAIHPAQVPVINRALSPSPAQIDAARAIVAALAAAPAAGAVQLDGRMLDAPHLAQARSLLRRAERVEPGSGMRAED